MKSAVLTLALATTMIAPALSQNSLPQPTAYPRQVSLPYDRLVRPAGIQIIFGEQTLENHAMDAALSPDGLWLAVMERYSIIFISTADNSVKFRLANNSNPALRGGLNTYSGIKWYKNRGIQEVFWSVIGAGDKSYVVSAVWDGTKAAFKRSFLYDPLPGADMALPNEILLEWEDGHEYIYVVLNGNNQVIKQDLETADTVWITSPGSAPYGIVKANNKLYVTNWAGRFPEEGDKDVAGIPWGIARVDNTNAGGATREGSVSVIDPYTGRIIKEILVGLHPNEIIADSRGRYVYITNSNSDNVSVIRTSRDQVSETISVRLQPEINPFFGDSPNGIAISHDNKTLYVANGMDNALAVIRLGKDASPSGHSGPSTVEGFIPTAAYPSAISVMKKGYLYVCNLEAYGAIAGTKNDKNDNIIYNSHRMLASVSGIEVPGHAALKAYTDTVIALNNLARATSAREKPRENIAAFPVPERIGEPSVFKHVLYIIKENRTYDQILGDMKIGRGDPTLCIYGEEVTPNTHKLCEDFLLLDNFMVSGKCSAEGHMWTDASIVTDYIEKNMRAWFRSYTHVLYDALVYAPTGFLWDNALRHGKSVKIYGEASVPVLEENLKWSDIYKKYLAGEKVKFKNFTTIEPVKPILSQTYPSYGSHEFSDVMRADDLIRELREYEQMPGDMMPELMVIALPNDHTAGTRPGYPTPRAMVADNDLALGRIVEAFSKSRFWKNTVIFVVEDDSQGGWDHVSAYRTVSLVISPYSRLRTVKSTYYTQPSMIRTIEQILGLPPMNIQDAIASPMFDCFGSVEDLTPYTALPNRIPLDEMNAPLSELSGRALHFAKMSMRPEFSKIDSGNDDLLNRILWFAAKGNNSYPAKYAGAGKNSEEDEEEEIEEYEGDF